MTKAEAITAIASIPQEELGDTLMQLAALYWRDEGVSDDEIIFLLEETLNGD